MNEIWNSRVRKTLHLVMLFAVFASFSSSCQAAADCSKYSGEKRQQCTMKKTYKINVTTVNDDGTKKSWYVSKDDSLNSTIECDKGSSSDYSSFIPCDTDGEHDNYYSTDDKKDDSLISPVERDFTITASAASYDTTMKNVRIEWMNGTKNVPDSWESARSRTCSGKSCTICRKGGTCKYQDILPTEISANADGSQNVLWFRVIITDNADIPNSITTGWDGYLNGWTKDNVPPQLDKYYRFVMCSAICGEYCSKLNPSTPVIKSMSITDKCTDGKPYIFNWTVSSPDGQSAFKLEIEDKATGDNVFSQEVESGDKSYTLDPEFLPGGGILKNGNEYVWRLRIRDNNDTPTCQIWSQWKSQSFKVCDSASTNTAPVVSATDTIPAASCSDRSNLNHTLKWTFSDAEGDSQSYYRVKVKEKGTNVMVYDSGNVKNSSKQMTIGSDYLSADKAYYWMVQVKDNNADSLWSDWVKGDYMYTASWPLVTWSLSCTSGKDCYINSEMTFTSTGAAYVPSYDWYVDSKLSSVHNPSLTRLFTSGTSHTINLKVTDGYGRFCNSSKDITLTESPCSTSLSLPAEAYVGEKVKAVGGASGDTESPIKYYWALDGKEYTSDNQPAQDFTFSSPRTYLVGVYAADASKTCSGSAKEIKVTATATENCEASISLDKDTVYYYGDTLYLGGSASPLGSNPVFKWTVTEKSSGKAIDPSPADGPSTSFIFPESKAASTKYIIKLHVTDDDGRSCDAFPGVEVIVRSRSPKWDETIPDPSLVRFATSDLLKKVFLLRF